MTDSFSNRKGNLNKTINGILLRLQTERRLRKPIEDYRDLLLDGGGGGVCDV
jgi:hypothetical protein